MINKMDKVYFENINTQSNVGEKGKYEFEELSRKIIGAAVEVHRELGPGYLENIYEEALKIDLKEHGLHFECQKEIKIEYLGVVVRIHRLDLVIENEIIVELKTVKELAYMHFVQLRSYLKATGLKVGLLLNFAKPALEIKRIVK
jgi:GxxExxY protein